MIRFKFLGPIHSNKHRPRNYHRFQLSTGHVVEIYRGSSKLCHVRVWENNKSKRIVSSHFNLSAKVVLGRVRLFIASKENPDVMSVANRVTGKLPPEIDATIKEAEEILSSYQLAMREMKKLWHSLKR